MDTARETVSSLPGNSTAAAYRCEERVMPPEPCPSGCIFPNPQHATVWSRIENYPLDRPTAAVPLTHRLTEENGWTAAYCARVVHEYKRFMLLCVVAGRTVSPSEDVDQVWHMHMLYTRDYWDDFCPNILGRTIHHEPSNGGAEQYRMHFNLYRETLDRYWKVFGERPPSDIWPAPAERFATKVRRVDCRRHWILAKPDWSAWWRGLGRSWLGALALAGALSGCATLYDSHASGGFTSKEFFTLYFWSAVATLAIATALRHKLIRPPRLWSVRTETLHTYDWAYLAGGESRVVHTAIGALVVAGALTPGPNRRLVPVPNASVPNTCHPIERECFSMVINNGGRVPEAAPPAAMSRMRERLREAGALPELRQLKRARRVSGGLVAIVALAGIPLLAYGLENGNPVFYLTVVLFVLAYVASYYLIADPREWRGSAPLVDETKSHFPIRKGSTLDIPQLLPALALFGAGILPDGTFKDLKALLLPSSGGGGGSEGGGCGGCGGGGS